MATVGAVYDRAFVAFEWENRAVIDRAYSKLANQQTTVIGSTLAHYEITGHLGTGGMGEVYQATDSKLGRSVAIKFLPEAFASDTERVARFQRVGREELLLASDNDQAGLFARDWSSDGRYFVFEKFFFSGTTTDIWILPLFGEKKPVAFLRTPARETEGQI